MKNYVIIWGKWQILARRKGSRIPQCISECVDMVICFEPYEWRLTLLTKNFTATYFR